MHVRRSEALEDRAYLLARIGEIETGIAARGRELFSAHALAPAHRIHQFDRRQQGIARRVAARAPHDDLAIDFESRVELRQVEFPPARLRLSFDEAAIGNTIGDALDQRRAAVIAKTR